MIGSGLKKLAKENGLKVSKGVAYGSLRGYAATLSEGSGYKRIVLNTKFTDVDKKNGLQIEINRRNVSKELRVQNLTITPDGIEINFNDTVGTLKKMQAFIDWFFPLLDAASATKADICHSCGMQITSGCWKLIDGRAYYLHDACAQKMISTIEAEDEAVRGYEGGSYITGLIGALLGSTVGAIVWALVLLLGYVASLVGLLIGWLAEKGYTLLRGKQGKGKILILVLAVIFGVVLGTVAAEVLSVAKMIAEGDLPGFGYGDIPMLMQWVMEDNPDYIGILLKNMGMGLIFAALGVFALLNKTGQEVAGTKIQDLE